MTKKFRNHFSTIMGCAVAVANAWITIDWDNFSWSGNTVMKLLLSALVALGGYMTSVNSNSLNERNGNQIN